MGFPMLAMALKQIRCHPTRYLSTMVSIAISVGFMASAAIIPATVGTTINDNDGITGGGDPMSMILTIFAAIAVITGLITITNTFTILLEQRRTKVGLLRSIGASTTQIRRSVFLEAIVLSLVSGIIGVGLACGLAVVVGLFIGS